MSQQTIARLESGTRVTGVDDLVALAKVFGVSLGWMLGPIDEVFGLGTAPVRPGPAFGSQSVEGQQTIATLVELMNEVTPKLDYMKKLAGTLGIDLVSQPAPLAIGRTVEAPDA